MQANTSNLDLANSGPNTLKMTLRSTERHHEMEDILVPPAAGGIGIDVQYPLLVLLLQFGEEISLFTFLLLIIQVSKSIYS